MYFLQLQFLEIFNSKEKIKKGNLEEKHISELKKYWHTLPIDLRFWF